MFSCGAGVVFRGSNLQDRGRYEREWSKGGWRRPAFDGARHNDSVGSWSLGGRSVEAVTGETKLLEEALERRTRRFAAGHRAIIRG